MPREKIIIEIDFSEFQGLEQEVAELLMKYSKYEFAENTECFRDGFNICHNSNSGYTFLSDEDGKVLLLNDDDKLEEWISCAECGEEGFKSEFKPEPEQLNYYQLHRIKHKEDEDEYVFVKSGLNVMSVREMIEVAISEGDLEQEEKTNIDTAKKITKEDYYNDSDEYLDEDEDQAIRCSSCHKKMF